MVNQCCDTDLQVAIEKFTVFMGDEIFSSNFSVGTCSVCGQKIVLLPINVDYAEKTIFVGDTNGQAN